jgi:crotonyl-CoA carboxylase/reductase
MRQKRFQGSHFANDVQAAGANTLVMEGKMDPCLSKVFPFEATGECHQLMRDNKHPSGNMAILVNAPRPGLKTLAEVRTAS